MVQRGIADYVTRVTFHCILYPERQIQGRGCLMVVGNARSQVLRYAS